MPRQTFSFRPQWMRKFDPVCETAFLSGGRGICIALVLVCLDFLILFFVFCFWLVCQACVFRTWFALTLFQLRKEIFHEIDQLP